MGFQYVRMEDMCYRGCEPYQCEMGSNIEGGNKEMGSVLFLRQIKHKFKNNTLFFISSGLLLTFHHKKPHVHSK